ncbi:MAG: signal peptidase I [Acidimicrobiales bacterium]
MSQDPPDGTPQGAPPDPTYIGSAVGQATPDAPASSSTWSTVHDDGTGTVGAPEAPGGTGPPAGGGTGGTGESAGPRGRHRRRGRHRWLVEWAVIIVLALVAAFLVRTYVLETFFVPSTSMWPTLKDGDRIVVNKLYGTIHTGDIIVFKRPPAEDCGGPPVPDLVKRVVGLPGQTVSAKNGNVYITGKRLSESWLPKGTQTRTTMQGSYTVPKGDYYVMGDNRVDSCDSRMWGPVKASYVVGKVFLIIWPPGRLRFF